MKIPHGTFTYKNGKLIEEPKKSIWVDGVEVKPSTPFYNVVDYYGNHEEDEIDSEDKGIPSLLDQ